MSIMATNNDTMNSPSYTRGMLSLEEQLVRRMSRPVKLPEPISYTFTNDIGMLHQYRILREDQDMIFSAWDRNLFAAKADAFDITSHTMIVSRGRHCIGGGRLTVSTKEHREPLPMEASGFSLEHTFPELQISKRNYAELSRVAILPEFREGPIVAEVARRFAKKAIEEGAEYVFSMGTISQAHTLRSALQLFGLRCDIRTDINIPDQVDYESVHMAIAVLDLRQQVREKALHPAHTIRRIATLAE